MGLVFCFLNRFNINKAFRKYGNKGEVIAKVASRPLNPPQGAFLSNQGLKNPPAGRPLKYP